MYIFIYVVMVQGSDCFDVFLYLMHSFYLCINKYVTNNFTSFFKVIYFFKNGIILM